MTVLLLLQCKQVTYNPVLVCRPLTSIHVLFMHEGSVICVSDTVL